MLSVNTEHVCYVPRSLNISSPQLLILLTAELSGTISDPRNSILHLLETILYKHSPVAFLYGMHRTSLGDSASHCCHIL